MLAGSSQIALAFATTNSTSNVNKPLYKQIEDLIENPFFAPDASCLFDTYQLHCIPGDHQQCPKPQFGGNEDGTCFPKTNVNGTWKWECPPKYHGEDEDETGQCYPDTEPCYPGQIMHPDKNMCGDEDYVCEDNIIAGCTIDGIQLEDYPDEYCLTNPGQDKCAMIKDVGCPEGFATMNSQNFTTQRCVPESVEDVERAERETGI